jgi:hypothetical protein
MKIAGQICIYTNDRVTIEELNAVPATASDGARG